MRYRSFPGRLLALAAGALLLLSAGCGPAAKSPALPAGFNPEAEANFQAYSKAPLHKAFALCVDHNGEAHSWARA